MSGWDWAAANPGLAFILGCLALMVVVAIAGFATDGIRGKARFREIEARARLVEAENVARRLAAADREAMGLPPTSKG